MGRPKRVHPNALHKYNLLHTRKAKMFSGVELTALHLVKEADVMYTSLESWAFCCSKFKASKAKTKLQYDIPLLNSNTAIEFLDKRAWKDYVAKQLSSTNGKRGNDVAESVALLDRLFPEKKKVYFYELKSIISAYCSGVFISHNDDGTVEEPDAGEIEQRKYYTYKYNRFKNPTDEIKALWDAYKVISEDKSKEKEIQLAFDAYYRASEDYFYENHDMTPMFIDICSNSVVIPYVFTRCTVTESEYENAGEIYVVVTPEAVYFEIDRHY